MRSVNIDGLEDGFSFQLVTTKTRSFRVLSAGPFRKGVEEITKPVPRLTGHPRISV